MCRGVCVCVNVCVCVWEVPEVVCNGVVLRVTQPQRWSSVVFPVNTSPALSRLSPIKT